MAVKVSVIVAVSDTAPDLDRNLKSMLAQTLPRDEYEVVYVADGVNAETQAKLDRAGAHPQVTVVPVAGPGSYGRARNLGLGRARGEFVQFVDDDDFLAPDALRRLHEFAVANEADIVLPKLSGEFPEVPHAVFQRTAGRIGLADVVDALTGQKMFRRAFLDEHGLRFPEGRRLMEDQLFVAEAYCATDRIAVHADYPSYHWRDRHQAIRGPGGLHEPDVWFAHLSALADTFTSRLQPGPGLDRALARIYREGVHAQLARRIDWADPGQGFDPWYEEARKTLAAHMPDRVGPALGAFDRIASVLLERGDRDRLVDWYRLTKSVRADARLERAAWGPDGDLELAFTARLTWAGAPVRFERDGDRVLLDRSLAERFALDPAVLDVTAELAAHTGRLHLTHRQERVRWPVPAEFAQVVTEDGKAGITEDGDGGLTVAFKASGAVATEAYGARERLDRGLWDVGVDLVGFGLTRSLRLGADRDPDLDLDLGPAVLGSPARGVIPFFTVHKGELTIDIGKKTRSLTHHLTGRTIEPVGGMEKGLLLDAATAPSTAQTGATLTVEDAAGAWYEVQATLRPFEGRWRLTPPRTVQGPAPGNGRLFVRLDPGTSPPLPLGDIHIGSNGVLTAERSAAAGGH